MKKKLTLGLFGFGCVGQGLYRVLQETKGLQTEIRRICILNPEKSRSLPAELFTTSREALLDDPEIDVIVELINDPDKALDIVRGAVNRGKDVVTANKRMLAEHLDEILALQKATGRSILYEAAVCGSIPIIRNLEEYYDNDSLSRIEGIFNGSTNYILTRIDEERLSFDEALKAAQDLGFAELDPSLDVEGFDPTFKLSILIAHAFGKRIPPEDILRIGIGKLSPSDLSYARKNNLKIKLVAGAYSTGETITALVAPKFVRDNHALFPIRNEFNAVVVEGSFAEEQLFVGKGAGGNPTGAAVLSDIAALRYGYRYEYRKWQENTKDISSEPIIEVSVGFENPNLVSFEDFIAFYGGERVGKMNRMWGSVSWQTLRLWAETNGISVVLSPEALPAVRTRLTIAEQALV